MNDALKNIRIHCKKNKSEREKEQIYHNGNKSHREKLILYGRKKSQQKFLSCIFKRKLCIINPFYSFILLLLLFYFFIIYMCTYE